MTPRFSTSWKAVAVTAMALMSSLLANGQARAATFSVSGINTGSTADVTFDYTATNATTGTLSISIENTSAVGDLTGFAFNLPSGFTFSTIGGNADGNGETALASPSNWFVDFHTDNIGADSTGQYDVGVMDTNSNFINGGSTGVDAINPGEAVAFSLTVTGSGLGSLATADFLSTLSSGNPSGNGNHAFVVRIQGLPGQPGSDFLVPPGGPPPQTEVPEPASIALVAVGALGFGASRLRRKRGLKQA
jgi:hypothetical protein